MSTNDVSAQARKELRYATQHCRDRIKFLRARLDSIEALVNDPAAAIDAKLWELATSLQYLLGSMATLRRVLGDT